MLPLAGLMTLATAAFVTLLTEILPAGLLSAIAASLDISESLAGQFITSYAFGTLASAIPVTVLTQGVRRRRLLLVAIGGFAIVNLVTATSGNYAVSIVARFFAGIFGGIVWSLLVGYSVRMSPPHLAGRAIAISGAGGTMALVFGAPIGSFLGRLIGWQTTFALISVLCLALILLLIAVVPDFPGYTKQHRQSLTASFSAAGIRPVLFVVFSFIAAHNILYIYVEPLLQPAGMSAKLGFVLFIFGLGSIAGIWIVGALIERHLQFLAVASVATFGCTVMLMSLWGNIEAIVYSLVVAWGIAVGGFSTITQTALARFAGDSIDVAQSIYTTGWNVAIAVGGGLGGLLLQHGGTGSFSWVVLTLLVASFACVIFGMNRVLSLPSRS